MIVADPFRMFKILTGAVMALALVWASQPAAAAAPQLLAQMDPDGLPPDEFEPEYDERPRPPPPPRVRPPKPKKPVVERPAAPKPRPAVRPSASGIKPSIPSDEVETPAVTEAPAEEPVVGGDTAPAEVPPVATGIAPTVYGVVLGGLDKIAARTAKFEVPLGQSIAYNTLAITVHTCRTRPPEEPPESAVYLDIQERRPNGSLEKVFSGWMFGSSPALNALEHPIYDVWVITCKTARPDTAAPAAPNS